MLSQLIDVTNDFNANNGVKLDVSQWQYCTIQFTSTTSGTINITGTNDPNAVQGVSDGGGVESTNYSAIQANKLSDGSAVTSISAAGLYKITVGTKFIQIGGASAATAGKVLVFLTTIP